MLEPARLNDDCETPTSLLMATGLRGRAQSVDISFSLAGQVADRGGHLGTVVRVCLGGAGIDLGLLAPGLSLDQPQSAPDRRVNGLAGRGADLLSCSRVLVATRTVVASPMAQVYGSSTDRVSAARVPGVGAATVAFEGAPSLP
jgi:hypothetical protein